MNIRFETIKLLEEKEGGKLLDTDLGKGLSKAKINKWDYIKLKNLCTAKETTNKTKNQPIEWEKIFLIRSLYPKYTRGISLVVQW